MSENQPQCRTSQDAETIAIAGIPHALLVTGDDSGGAYVLAEMFVPPGGGPPPHTHTREDEVFYVLSGEFTFLVGGREIIARPGATVNAPRDVEHTLRNTAGETSRALVWIQPAGLEEYFREVGVLMDQATDPAPDVTPEQIEKLLAAGPRYGLRFRLPE